MVGSQESSSLSGWGKLAQIHWIAPASMLGGWTIGILFAAGHHLFYQYVKPIGISLPCLGNLLNLLSRNLNGKTASTTGFFLLGSSISDQEANTAIGTAFAYLVKACLVFAMSIAFVQVFWSGAKAQTTTPRTLARLDATFSAFYDVPVLFNVPIWLRFPVLLSLAGTAWCATNIAPLLNTSDANYSQVDTNRFYHNACHALYPNSLA